MRQDIDNRKSESDARKKISMKSFKILLDFIILMLNESSNTRILIK